jgi:hypothetical protein
VTLFLPTLLLIFATPVSFRHACHAVVQVSTNRNRTPCRGIHRITINNFGLGVPKAVTINSKVFWVIRRSGGTYRLHHHGRKIYQARTLSFPPTSVIFRPDRPQQKLSPLTEIRISGYVQVLARSYFVDSKEFCRWCVTLRILGFWTLSIVRYSKN